MVASKEDIRRWLKDGKDQKARYMLVVCDTYDHSDYPAYSNEEDYDSQYNHFNDNNMQHIMEIYDLDMDIEKQLNEHRAYNGPKKK